MTTGSWFACCEVRCSLTDTFHHITRRCNGEVTGGAVNRPGTSQVNRPVTEHGMYLWEAPLQVKCEGEFVVCSTPREVQCCTDLSRSQFLLVRVSTVSKCLGDCCHSCVGVGLVMRRHTLMCP